MDTYIHNATSVAPAVAAEILALPNGLKSSAQQVVDAASSPSSAMHSLFVWPSVGANVDHKDPTANNEGRVAKAAKILDILTR